MRGNSSGRRFYEPELDVLRFCAFLSVFAYHSFSPDFLYSALLPRLGTSLASLFLDARNAMSFGVCTFFLLSSYLITKLLVLERESTGTISMNNFYIRRVLRIWPLYLAFLLTMWCLGRVGIFTFIETGRLMAFLFFSGNIYSALHGFTPNPILPLWTISIEEQFYMLWPALARNGLRTLRAVGWTIIGISVGSIVLLRLFSHSPVLTVWTSSFVHFQFFAIGSLLAIRFSHQVPRFAAAVRICMAIIGVVALLIAAGPLHVNNLGLPPVSTFGFVLAMNLWRSGLF